MLAKRSAMASLQSDFYREQYHKLLRWLMALLFIMFLLIATVIYLVLFQPSRHYYADTVDGRILPMPKVILGSAPYR